VFVNRCRTIILNVKRPDKISKEELYHRTKETPIEQTTEGKKRCWIGHRLRKPQSILDTQWTAIIRAQGKWVDQEQLAKEQQNSN
jgi:hypothetical protein